MATLEQLRAERALRQQGGSSVGDRLRAERQRRQQGNGVGLENGYQSVATDQRVIATTSDGGRVIELPDGRRAFASPGYSTTDAAKIDEIMQGATPAHVVQNDFDQERLSGNMAGARANEIARGFPFVGSYADEAMGLVSPGRADNMRQLSGAMQRQRPGETTALNVGGAIMGAIPAAVAAAPAVAAAAPASIGAQAMTAAGAGSALGAVEGGIYGYGEGTTPAERRSEAASGASVGAVAGAALGAAAPYANAGLKRLMGRLKGSDVSVISRELGISTAAATQIRNTLEVHGIDRAVQELAQAGDNAMLANAGKPMAQLLDAAAATGGGAARIASDAVGERTRGASDQLVTALDNAFGAPRGEKEIISAVRSGSQPARSAAYNAAYSQPIDYSEAAGRRLEALLARVPEQAIREAEQIMSLREETSSQIMARIGENGRVTFETLPDVKQVHYIMQALDDMAKSTDGTGAFGRQNTKGASVAGLRRQIADGLKSAVPEFATAQNIAADTARQIEMTELGYDLLRPGTRRETARSAFAGVSGAEREAARQGVRAFLDDTTANVARTITDPDTTTREGIRILRDMSTRANRTKLRSLLGTREANALLEQVDEAATAFEIRAAIAENSKTAIRQGLQQGGRELADGGVLNQLARGEPVNATKRIVQGLTGETEEARQLRQMGFFEDVAKALTEQRGGRARSSLRIIQSAMNGQGISQSQAQIIANTIVGSGVLAGHRATSLALQ